MRMIGWFCFYYEKQERYLFYGLSFTCYESKAVKYVNDIY